MTRFLESGSGFAGAEWVMFGVPSDATVSRRGGARYAPDVIRCESHHIESYSPSLDRDLKDVSFVDLGNIFMSPGDVQCYLTKVEKVVASFAGKGKRILMIGGDHLVSLAGVRGVISKYSDLHVLHFDAHADLRDFYLGNRYSHATVMRRVAECLVKTKRLHQFAIRSGSKEEIEWGKRNTDLHLMQLSEPLGKVIDEIGDSPVYVSLDIDVLDPSVAPGTGTPEPNGIGVSDLFDVLRNIKGLNVVGFDLVEISPPNDVNNVTSLLGAKIVREVLITLGGDSVDQ